MEAVLLGSKGELCANKLEGGREILAHRYSNVDEILSTRSQRSRCDGSQLSTSLIAPKVEQFWVF